MPEPGRVLTRPEIEAMMRSEFLPSAFVVGALARSHEQLREKLANLTCAAENYRLYSTFAEYGEHGTAAFRDLQDALSAGEEIP